MIDKKAINYYYSFFEVSKDLNQKQFYEFNMAIMSVMFFEKHIDEIKFSDQLLNIIWKSVKHSVLSSVKGYCDKKSIPYDDLFNAPCQPPCQQEQEKEQVQVQQVFSFTLKKLTSFENLSKEYKGKLKEYIGACNGMTYQDFENTCIMKDYKYKNFKMAYDKWGKDKTHTNSIKAKNKDVLI